MKDITSLSSSHSELSNVLLSPPGMQRRAVLKPVLASSTYPSRHLRHCSCCHHTSSTPSLHSSSPAPAENRPSASLPDDPSITHACVTGIHTLSPTVRQLDLRLLCNKELPARDPFSFVAGQWVDFFVPSLPHCGGFSMVSPPEILPRLSLAIKGSSLSRSLHARWAHSTVAEGDMVGLRVGGGFHFQMTEAHWVDGTRLTLFAGGVGINPMMSILAHVVSWIERKEVKSKEGREEGERLTGEGALDDRIARGLGVEENCAVRVQAPFRVALVYSAATRAELLFEEQIQKWAEQHSEWFSVLFIVTREKGEGKEREGGGEGGQLRYREGSRMDEKVIWDAVEGGEGIRGRKKALVYVCGPAKMIDDVEDMLLGKLKAEGARVGRCCLEASQVVAEKWW